MPRVLLYSFSEIVYLNATDLVVGVEDAEKYWDITGRPYRLAHPELANLTSIARGGPDNPTPYAEEIVKLKPDVINSIIYLIRCCQ